MNGFFQKFRVCDHQPKIFERLSVYQASFQGLGSSSENPTLAGLYCFGEFDNKPKQCLDYILKNGIKKNKLEKED